MDVLRTTRISKKAMTAGVIAAVILGGGVSEASGLVGSANSRADVGAQMSSATMLNATLTGLTDLRADTASRIDLEGTSVATVTGNASTTTDVAAPARVTILGPTAVDLRTASEAGAGATVQADMQVAAGTDISIRGGASGRDHATTVDSNTSTDVSVGLGLPPHLKGSGLLGISLR